MNNRDRPPEAPTARNWIYGRDARKCGHIDCIGYDKADGKIIQVNKLTGELQCTCKHCDRTTTRQLTRWKEPQNCKRCGDGRVVVVSWFNGRMSWRQNCEPCELEVSAGHHAAQAAEHLAKAKKIRAARKDRKRTMEAR